MKSHAPLTDATRTVNAKIGFGIHLAVFLIVNALLVAINIITTPDRLWFPWALGGWGIGLALHAAALLSRTHGRDLKAAMIQNELSKQGR